RAPPRDLAGQLATVGYSHLGMPHPNRSQPTGAAHRPARAREAALRMTAAANGQWSRLSLAFLATFLPHDNLTTNSWRPPRAVYPDCWPSAAFWIGENGGDTLASALLFPLPPSVAFGIGEHGPEARKRPGQ